MENRKVRIAAEGSNISPEGSPKRSEARVMEEMLWGKLDQPVPIF